MYSYRKISLDCGVYSFALISHTVVYDNVEDGSSVCKYNKYTNIVLLSVFIDENI